jgi:hypothetical protein
MLLVKDAKCKEETNLGSHSSIRIGEREIELLNLYLYE